MNLGFQNLRPTYLKRTFFNCDTFSSYLFEVIFALLTFGDRGVRVSRAYPKVKNPVVCTKFCMGSKFHFSQWKTYFTEFINKFLKFEEMEYLIYHVKVEIWPALCKIPILFSAVKFKFGHNFYQFIYTFKSFESWS